MLNAPLVNMFLLTILLFSPSLVQYRFQHLFSMIELLIIFLNNFSNLSLNFVYTANFSQIF